GRELPASTRGGGAGQDDASVRLDEHSGGVVVGAAVDEVDADAHLASGSEGGIARPVRIEPEYGEVSAVGSRAGRRPDQEDLPVRLDGDGLAGAAACEPGLERSAAGERPVERPVGVEPGGAQVSAETE